MYNMAERAANWLARLLAYAGGAVLLVLILLNTISIIGRVFVPLEIGIGPIRGIYDITEIGMAAAIFAFLPWAQMQDAHAKVDLFRSAIPGVMDNFLQFLFAIAMLVVAIYGTWRMYLGMDDKFYYGETTLIAQIPVGWGYAAGMVGAVGFIIVAAFCVVRALRRMIGWETANV